MDFNWVDWAIVGVTALGLLFGLISASFSTRTRRERTASIAPSSLVQEKQWST